MNYFNFWHGDGQPRLKKIEIFLGVFQACWSWHVGHARHVRHIGHIFAQNCSKRSKISKYIY